MSACSGVEASKLCDGEPTSASTHSVNNKVTTYMLQQMLAFWAKTLHKSCLAKLACSERHDRDACCGDIGTISHCNLSGHIPSTHSVSKLSGHQCDLMQCRCALKLISCKIKTQRPAHITMSPVFVGDQPLGLACTYKAASNHTSSTVSLLLNTTGWCCCTDLSQCCIVCLCVSCTQSIC